MENEMITIFDAFCSFILSQDINITSTIMSGMAYDGIKKVLNFSALKSKISKFFKNEKDTEKYLETVINSKSKNELKPYRDIEDAYEEITGSEFKQEMLDIFSTWIKENNKQILESSKLDFKNESGFNIGTQNASGDIINVQGNYSIDKNKD